MNYEPILFSSNKLAMKINPIPTPCKKMPMQVIYNSDGKMAISGPNRKADIVIKTNPNTMVI